MKKIGLVCILLLLVLLTTTSAFAESKTVFVLFDVSRSTLGSRKEYLDGFKKILDIRSPGEASQSRLGLRDAIAADVITANSLSTSEMPIEHEFNYSFWSGLNETFYGYKSIAVKKHLAEEAKKLLFSQEAGGSDILNSLRLADRVFRRFKRDKSILVIFSDMIEQSGPYDFERDNLTNRRITEIIRQERAKGLPGLKGVIVYVAGARAASPTQFLKIRNFWLRYFRACGAVLDQDNYGRAFMGISR
ncbi:MAG: hypothetical protein M0Z61_08675 [Nitrospiraceae bacterium]|nr:hypothetical protein [Nitrospiraceae bacterium]